MRRTASALVLLAGFGGGCVSPDAKKEPTGGFGTVSRGKPVAGFQGPTGEPVVAARGAAPGGGVVQAGGVPAGGSRVEQIAGRSRKAAGCDTCAHVPGVVGSRTWGLTRPFGGHFAGFLADGTTHKSMGDPGPGGMMQAGGYGGHPNQGIMPVPGMGPPGAVAAFGAMVPGMGGGMGGPGGPTGAMSNGRTSIRFTGPAGMRVTWQLPDGGFNDEATGLTAPKEYNFVQGQVYRLRLTQVLPNHPGKSFYPTLEITPGNPKTLTFLAHASVPLTFTNEDFDQAVAGNLVVKVIYLPDRDNQDFATVAGAEELVSTRLEPGADPVAEAQRRGTVLAIIRLGNIDLENRSSPAMGAPGGAMTPPPGGPIMIPGPGGPVGGLPPGAGRAMPLPPVPAAPPATAPTYGAPVAPGPLPPMAPSGPPAVLPPVK